MLIPIIVARTGEYAVECSNVNKHGRPRNRDQFHEFSAKQNQWHYRTKLSFWGKTEIAAEHTNDGKCVLCIIDEKLRKV